MRTRRFFAAAVLALAACGAARADERLDEAVKKLGAGDAKAARTDLEALAKERPDDAAVQYHLGAACVIGKDLGAAKKAFERCIAIDPERTDARRALASIYSHDGKFEAAAKALEPAVASAPEDTKLRAELGTAYARAATEARDSPSRRTPLAEKAIACYRKILEAEPDFAPALYNIGIMLVLIERWPDAESTLASYVEKAPEDLAGLYNLAVARDHAGPADRAIETWRAFLAKAKDDPKFKRDVPYAQARIKALEGKKK
jgi:tetratricopeptide (TPR) repeat protein